MADTEARTPSEMVALIDKAVETVMVSGVAYGIDGRTLTRADIPSLLKARSHYVALENAAGNRKGGVLTYGVVF